MRTAPLPAFRTFRSLATPERLGLLGLLALLALLVLPLAGCGGGGAPETGNDAPSDPGPIGTVNGTGRVVLGALAGATVEIYRAGEYGSPVATATTSTGGTLGEIGRFTFTLPGAPPDAMFLFVASGGAMHDEDEDGVADGPTPCLGKVHALASVAEMVGREVRLSAVTDVVYHRVRYALQALYDDAHVRKSCDAWASSVLRREVAGGAGIDNDDAIAYDPRLHGNATFRPHADFVDYVQRLATGATSNANALSAQELDFQRYGAQQWRGVDHVDGRAYVCAGPAGLTIWDVSNPTNPVALGSYDTPGTALAVRVSWPFAYVADGEKGLRILDISNPAAPTFVGALDAGGYVADLCVDGRRVYLADAGQSTMRMVSVVEPSAPMTIGSWPASGVPTGVRVDGDVVYLLEENHIEVVDVSSPGDLFGLGFVPCNGGDMDIGDGFLFTVTGGRLQVFSLGGGSTLPQLAAEFQLQGLSGESVRVDGDRVILGTNLGLAVVDVTDAWHPKFEGVIPTSLGVIDMAPFDDLFVVTTWDGGLGVVAGGTPPPSGVIATFDLPTYLNGIDAAPNRVYLTTEGPDELVVLDTSNPSAPAFLGSTALDSGDGQELVVVGTHAYVAEETGIHVYDVSNGAAPAHLGGTDIGTSMQTLTMGSGSILYATNGPFLGVFDVSNPALPRHLRTLPVSGDGRGLAHEGTTLVLAGGYTGLYTFDTTTPAVPAQRAHETFEGNYDVAMAGSFALLTAPIQNRNGGRLQVVDCSDAGNPTNAGEVSFPTPAGRVARAGNFAYTGWGGGGVNVVNLTDPTAPQPAGTIPVPWPVHYLAVGGGYVYVAGNGYPDTAVQVLRGAQVVVP